MDSTVMKRWELVTCSIENSSLTNLKVMWPIAEERRMTTFQLRGLIPNNQDM